jgi:dihydroorotate dehydrogenase/NAD-dependent dihydropyrimidine dehydrogenase PreA subunit
MLNAEWTGADIEYWIPYLERLSNTDKIIFSVSGRDIEDCVKVCEILDKFSFLMLEVNVSCAHSNNVHGFITRNGEHIQKLVTSIKNAGVKTPIGIKLGYSDYIVELAQITKDAGADAIIALNTFGPVLDFSVEKKGKSSPVLGIESGKGGMSGAALFNIALTSVADISYKVGIPVVACGGVSTPEQIVKMIMAGADAVQIYTAAHVYGVNAPSYFSKLQKDLEKYLADMDIDSLEAIKGSAHRILGQKTNIIPEIPTVNSEKCTGCDICVPVCLPKAIDIVEFDNKLGHVVEINEDLCVGCGHCEVVCPFDAFDAKK